MAEEQSSHQLVRAPSSIVSHAAITISSLREDSSDVNRQFHSRSLHQKPGRDQISSVTQTHGTNPTVSRPVTNPVDPQTYNRTTKCTSGLSIKDEPSGPLGVVSLCEPLPMDISDVTMGPTDGGPIRESVESPSATIHVPVPGRASRSDRCPDSSVAERSSVCLSPSLSATTPVDPLPTTDGVTDVTSVSVESTRKVTKSSKTLSTFVSP